MEKLTENQYKRFIDNQGKSLHEAYATFTKAEQMNMIISISNELIRNKLLKNYLIHSIGSDRKIVLKLSADIFDSVQEHLNQYLKI